MAVIKGMTVESMKASLDLEVRVALRSGSMNPILLRNVEREDNGELYPNAMICVEGSEIAIGIRSKGPCGFGFRIQTIAAPIVEELFSNDDSCSGNTRDAWESAHSFKDDNDPRNGMAIKVEAIDSGIANTNPDLFKAMWECQVYTWPIYGYRTEDGNTFGTPRGEVSADVRPGTLTTGSDTGVTHGKIYNMNQPANTYQSPEARYLAFWVFVFKSQNAVNEYVESYGEPSVDGWG